MGKHLKMVIISNSGGNREELENSHNAGDKINASYSEKIIKPFLIKKTKHEISREPSNCAAGYLY